jgi:hypothetical protein
MRKETSARILLSAAMLLLAFSGAARAGCIPLGKLDNEEDDCLNNGKYVESAISCFVDFESLVKAKAGVAAGQLEQSNAAHLANGKNSQANGEAGGASDYKIAVATLDGLIAAGKAARSSIDSYSKNIYFPEDFDAPPEVIGDPMGYLDSSPCYAEPRDMLQDMLQRADLYIADLERSRQAALAMLGTTSSRDTQLGAAADTRAPASAARGRSGPALKGKKQRNPAPDITGVDNDKKKREQVHE